MTSLLAAPVDLLGVQEPRISCVPSYVSSAGEEAIDVYSLAAERELDPWQQATLEASQGERADGRWAAFEVGLVVARQNGKDEILAARELAGLFLWDERLIIHSAHKFDTAMEHMERLVELIDNVPEFRKRVRGVNRSHGREGITLRSGARIRFRARTRSGGARGYTGDCVIFNEAMDLPDEIIGSIMPTMSARSMRAPGPQIWLAGSAVDQTTMANGIVLARVREAGIAGANPRLAYFEHSADIEAWLGDRFDPDLPDVDQITPAMLTDRTTWGQANPALGLRISVEHVETERWSPSMSPRQFAIERLGIGDWPDISEESGRVITREAWALCVASDPDHWAACAPTFAVDASVDETWASIGAAGSRADGLPQVTLEQHERGTDWVVAQCVQLKTQHRRAQFVVDKGGPAKHLIPALKSAGVRVLEASTQDYGDACADFKTAVNDAKVRYPAPQLELDDAVANARKAPMGDRWKWSRKDSASADISPLVAVTLAFWGHCQAPAKPRVLNLNDFV